MNAPQNYSSAKVPRSSNFKSPGNKLVYNDVTANLDDTCSNSSDTKVESASKDQLAQVISQQKDYIQDLKLKLKLYDLRLKELEGDQE